MFATPIADTEILFLLRASTNQSMGFSGGTRGKEPAFQRRKHRRLGFNPWVRKIPWRRAWQSTPVFLPGESHGQRSLVGYSPWSRKALDMTAET